MFTTPRDGEELYRVLREKSFHFITSATTTASARLDQTDEAHHPHLGLEFNADAWSWITP